VFIYIFTYTYVVFFFFSNVLIERLFYFINVIFKTSFCPQTSNRVAENVNFIQIVMTKTISFTPNGSRIKMSSVHGTTYISSLFAFRFLSDPVSRILRPSVIQYRPFVNTFRNVNSRRLIFT